MKKIKLMKWKEKGLIKYRKKKERILYKLVIENLPKRERIVKNIFVDELHIGTLSYNNIVLESSKNFNFLIKKMTSYILLVNLTLQSELTVENSGLRFLTPYVVPGYTEILVENYKIVIKPEIRLRTPKIKLKNLKIKCSYCGSYFDLENLQCSLCGFDGLEIANVYLNRYRNYFDLMEFDNDYNEYQDLMEEKTIFKGLSDAEIIILDGRLKGKSFPIIDEETTVGRSIHNSISLYQLEDLSISRYHFKIIKKINGYYIEDNNSLNGTYVNGSLIKRKKLKNNDIIYVGQTKLQFRYKKKGKLLWMKKR